MLIRYLISLVALCHLEIVIAGPIHEQAPFNSLKFNDEDEWTHFQRPIRKVAVIGAGPSGLQSAAALEREGFLVTLFERSETPGGVWNHNHITPARESYPNKPLEVAAFAPDPRDECTEFHKDGDDGISIEERWREHTRPSPVWDDLITNSPPFLTSLPEVDYPENAPWVLPAKQVQRVVRTYASYNGLNANDRTNDASSPLQVSYATRVELLEKKGRQWRLSLKRLQRLPETSQIRTDWWTEYFDAVVVAAGNYDAPFVPNVPGLVEWSKIQRNGHFPVHHSQAYRNPTQYLNKTVLIIGASVSASEISRNLGDSGVKLLISIRNTTRDTYMARRSIRRIHPDAQVIPEVVWFGPLSSTSSIADCKVQLLNGSWIGGIDEVILATGFRRSAPFLRDYYKKSNTIASNIPILTDGHSLQALSWTGHYIPDPTLAFANVRPWTLGRYQSLAFAKVWKGTARLPNEKNMWHEYFNDNHWQSGASVGFGSIQEEGLTRQFIAWLNQESLIHGGRFVDQWPIQLREHLVFYADQAWETGYTTRQNFTRYENTPRDQWPIVPPPSNADYEYQSASEW